MKTTTNQEPDSFDEPAPLDPAAFDLASATMARMSEHGYAMPDQVDIHLVLHQICRERGQEADYPGAEKLLDRLYFQCIPVTTEVVS